MHHQKPPLGTQLDWSNPLNDGLVMHLAMNEGHGDKVRDLSMNGNDGTLSNMAFPPTVDSGWNPSRDGIGIKFDGTNDCIAITPHFVVDTEFSMIIHAINDLSAAPTGQHLCGKYRMGDNERAYGLVIDTAEKISMIFGDPLDGTYNGMCLTNSPVSIEKWGIYGCTYDTGSVVLYLNGGIVPSTPTDIPSTLYNSVAPYTIGNNGDVSAPWNGMISCNRVFNRVLSAHEMREYAINPYQVYLDEDD